MRNPRGVGGWERSLTPHTPHTPHTPLLPLPTLSVRNPGLARAELRVVSYEAAFHSKLLTPNSSLVIFNF
ncbi:hypothetical protein H6G91_13555 [Nostoc muscorum FACHB-395]|nr:hypothetical protein [Desmonostoc muscorum FACHB-395]